MAIGEPMKTTMNALFDAGDLIGVQITRARSSSHPLTLPADVLAKMVEAQQAVFAAQRLLERHHWNLKDK